MAKAISFDTELLNHIFNNAAIAGIGDTNGVQPSAGAGSLYLAMHTADPTAAGNQSSSEVSYTGYARISIARSSAGFVVSGASVTLAANADFGEMTGGTGGTVTFFSVGKAASGATNILYSGAVSPSIAIATGVTPRLKLATSITES